MNQFEGMAPIRTCLRELVVRGKSALASLGPSKGGAKQHLEQAWLNLVAALAPGQEPESRSCSFCRRSIAQLAVRCRYCMIFAGRAGAGA